MIDVFNPRQKSPESGLHLMNPRRHLKEVARLLEETFSDVIDKPDRAPLQEMRWFAILARWLGNWVLGPGVYGSSVVSFVWLEEGRVIGHAMTHRLDPAGDRWQISNVAVKPAYRNRGIGRALMMATLDYIRSQRGLWAVLQVRENNRPAVHLYEGLGFSPIGGEIRWKLDLNALSVKQPLRYRKLRRVKFQHAHEVEALHKRCLGDTSTWWWQDRRPTLTTKNMGYWLRNLIGRAVHQRQGFWYNGHLIAFADIYVDTKYHMGEFSLCVDRAYWGHWEETLLLEILAQIRTWGGRIVYTQTLDDYPPLQTAVQTLGFQERFHLMNMRKPLF